MRGTVPRGLKARSLTVALATARCSGALRCPPIGGTADKVRKILSKIEVRSTRFLKKENNFFENYFRLRKNFH